MITSLEKKVSMLIITKAQRAQLDKYFLDQFASKAVKNFPDSSFEEVLYITNEALNYKVDLEQFVLKYISLYLTYKSEFSNKPFWIKNILEDNSFSTEDKLEHIERNLTN